MAAVHNEGRHPLYTKQPMAALQERGVLPWPVELGPEFVHGANSTLQVGIHCGIGIRGCFHVISTCVSDTFQIAVQDTLVEMGCKLTEYKWPDHWYFRDERRLKHASVKARPIFPRSMVVEVCNAQTCKSPKWSIDTSGAIGRMQT